MAVGQLNRFNLGDQFRPRLETKLDFGKYAGVTLKQVIDSDVDYVKWMLSPDGNKPIHSSAMEYFTSACILENVRSICDYDPRCHQDDLPF